jgi:polar amino acid transport system substrate-binding protein
MKVVHLRRLAVFITCMFTLQHNAAAKDIAVLAVDYPPFTSPSSANNGVVFTLLQQRTTNASIHWVPTFAPPARISQLIKEGKWCASFYPVNENIESKKIELSKSLVTIGLVRNSSKTESFEWEDLSELSGHSVALLRTSHESEFYTQFLDAGLEIVEVESLQAGVDMVLIARVDFSVADNISIELSQYPTLQFSRTPLLTTAITLFINPRCNIPSLSAH